MTQLAALLDLENEALVARWMARVRQSFDVGFDTDLELRDHVPQLIRELGAGLRRLGTPPLQVKAETAQQHARERYRLGFDLEAVVREYALLRDVIFDLVEERGVLVTMPEVRVFTAFMSGSIAEAVREDARRRRELLTVPRSVGAVAEMDASATDSLVRLVTDALPVLISFIDADERYRLINKSYESWFGQSRNELLGRTVVEMIGPDAYRQIEPYVKRALAGERFSFEQYQVPYRVAGVRDVKVTYVPHKDENGNVDGFGALLEDITLQRSIEADRELLAQQRAETLERQAEFEQQLIGIVSHDLRNPLNVIALASQLLSRREDLSAAALKNVVRIQNAADRSSRMVRDLLDFTQARLGGGIRIERRPTDLHALVRSVLEETEASFADRQIELRLEGDAQKDPGEWDPDRLAQVVQNLVTNALKYSPEGSAVKVVAEVHADAATIRVHNTGAAIPAEKLPTLFEPFTRAGAIDSASRSVGLGLYIVNRVVQAHGGAVEVESTAEEGTTFTVSLPRLRSV